MPISAQTTDFLDILNRTDVTDPDTALAYLSKGMTRVSDECRLWFMEKSVVLSSGETSLDADTTGSLVQIIDVTATDQAGREYPLTKLPWRRVIGKDPTDTPKWYGRFGNNFMIRGDLPSWSVGTIYYYSRFTPVTGLGDDNELSINAPMLMVYAGLTFAALRWRMDQAADWETEYQRLKNIAIQQTVDLDAEGGPQAIEPIFTYED